MSRITAFIIAITVCLLASLGWAVDHYRDNATEYKNQRDEAVKKSASSEAITANVIHTMGIINNITEANSNAKQQITLESQNAENDIKVAVANDDCSRQLVPVAAANRLRQYANSLRPGTSGADSVKPDF